MGTEWKVHMVEWRKLMNIEKVLGTIVRKALKDKSNSQFFGPWKFFYPEFQGVISMMMIGIAMF